MKVTTNIPGVLAKLEKLGALLPSVPPAAGGGGPAGKGEVARLRKKAFNNFVGGVGEGNVMGAMQQALSDTLSGSASAEKSEPERIVSVAVRHPDTGAITSAPNKLHAQLYIEAGIDTSNLPSAMYDLVRGFMTNHGRFVTADQASALAHKAKQLPKDYIALAENMIPKLKNAGGKASTGEVSDLAKAVIASYRGSPTAEGTLHECQAPAAAENRPGVVQRAVQAMQGYRKPALTYERDDILGHEEFTDAGGERRTRRIIREGAKKTRPVEYYPRKDQSRRLAEGGEVEVFKQEIAADLDRARQWVRDWVYSSDPEFGKHKDAADAADLEQTVTRIERLLGIQRGQDLEYNAEMKAAAAALLPHIQAYVDAYDPIEKQKEGVPPEELMSVFPSDLSRKLQAEGKKLNAQWSAAILSAWRKVAENLYPEFLAQGLRAAMRDAGWGEAAKGAQGRLGL